MASEVPTKSEGMTSGGDNQKKVHKKGGTHGLHHEILDDPNIKAESNWEKEDAEYWSSKMCKQYVKMYHIDKLWPRECHKNHNRDYCCNPRTCNDKHFVHRAEQVCRVLFRDKLRNKGNINYTLAAMVYSKLVLKRKVDWSTFPTTSQFPLLLSKDQRDIPDSYNVEAVATEALKKVELIPVTVSNATTSTAQVESTQQIPEAAGPSLSKAVETEFFQTPPPRLAATETVETVVEQKNASSKHRVMERRWAIFS